MRLTDERKRRGWSQSELSRRSGVHPTTISHIESGRFLPSDVQLQKLRLALGLRVTDARSLVDRRQAV